MSSIIRSRRGEAEAPHRGRSPHRVAASALAALAGLWAPAASADILLWSANSDLPQTFTYPNTGFVDLNGTAAGGASLTFGTTQANQRVIITFNARCSHLSGTGGVNVEILVDPAGSAGEFSAPPVNSIPTFCTGSPVRAATVASARPAVAGTHKVRVKVTLFTNDPAVSPTASIAATSLAVTR
jgi:hypothetical protein